MIFLAEEQKKQGFEGNNSAKNSPEQGKILGIFGQKHEKEARKPEQEQKSPGDTAAGKEQVNESEANPKENESKLKVKELTETLQRLQAEFENFQKRTAKQNEEYKSFANAKLLEEILPVLDSLENGMAHNKELKHVYEQLFLVLKKKGVLKINAEKGQKFDHNTMECMFSEKIPGQKDDTVAKVLVNGYLLNGKILRTAKVSVNVLGKDEIHCEDGEKIKDSPEKKQENQGIENNKGGEKK